MKQLILTQFPWPWLSVLALIIFFTFFLVIIARLCTSSQRALIAQTETLPLHDGERHE